MPTSVPIRPTAPIVGTAPAGDPAELPGIRPRDNAAATLSANLTALRTLQPELGPFVLPGNASPVWGRDGSPTFRIGGFTLASAEPVPTDAAAPPAPPPAAPPTIPMGLLASVIAANLAGGGGTQIDQAVWWRQCSVPRAASRAMLESLASAAPVSLFLHPMHPAAVTEALRILSPGQLVIALLDPDVEPGLFLACDDWTADIHRHRLLIATSTDHLAALLSARPGMPSPGMFIRTHTLPDDVCVPLITACQDLFRLEHDRRAARVAALLAPSHAPGNAASHAPGLAPGHTPGHAASHAPGHAPGHPLNAAPKAAGRTTRVVVSAPHGFTLWTDAARELCRITSETQGFEVVPWRSADPLSASALHLLELAQGADAVVAADFFRPDAQNLLPASVPLITWATTRRLVRFEEAGPLDHLLVTDSDLRKSAIAAGWPESRVEVMGWATPSHRRPAQPDRQTGYLAFIADTRPLRVPAAIEDYSSHRLLWERVFAELSANPMRVGNDLHTYLDNVRQSMDVPADGFPAEAIATELAIPHWQQQVARLLVTAGQQSGPGGWQARLFGDGWDELGDELLAAHWAGPIRSADALDTALAGAAAVVLPIPTAWPHPVEATVLPVLRPAGDPAALIRRARQLVRPGPNAKPPLAPAPESEHPLQRVVATVLNERGKTEVET